MIATDGDLFRALVKAESSYNPPLPWPSLPPPFSAGLGLGSLLSSRQIRTAATGFRLLTTSPSPQTVAQVHGGMGHADDRDIAFEHNVENQMLAFRKTPVACRDLIPGSAQVWIGGQPGHAIGQRD